MKAPFAIASDPSRPREAKLAARISSPEESNISEGRVQDLLNLHDGDKGVVKLIAVGPSVIPALRSFLFRRNRAGLYQPRCWAIEALAALHADDVLEDYLLAPQTAASDIERFGDEAVVNAAARALSKHGQSGVYELLLNIARTRPYPGVIEALGRFERTESIPILVNALAEDDCRKIAETALRRLKSSAESELRDALTRLPATPTYETERRQRQSILRLLK